MMLRAIDERRRRPSKSPSVQSWQKSTRLQETYGRALRNVAREVGRITSGFDPASPSDMAQLQDALTRYGNLLEPWAKQQSERLIGQIERQDWTMWRQASRDISAAMRAELENTPTGAIQADFMARQVTLIKSLPLEAAQRVHDLVLQGQTGAMRFEELAERIMETSQVTQSRATLIARTEISRAATEMTRARALQIGSESYIWETARDGDVRESHKRLQGHEYRWDDPPECDPGHWAHPGCIWNCRCWAAPVIPEI